MLNCTSAVSGGASNLPSAPVNRVLGAAFTVGACARRSGEDRRIANSKMLGFMSASVSSQRVYTAPLALRTWETAGLAEEWDETQTTGSWLCSVLYLRGPSGSTMA